MNEKLTRVRPRTLGQASRIPGVTPAAVSLINVYIEIQARQQTRRSIGKLSTTRAGFEEKGPSQEGPEACEHLPGSLLLGNDHSGNLAIDALRKNFLRHQLTLVGVGPASDDFV